MLAEYMRKKRKEKEFPGIGLSHLLFRSEFLIISKNALPTAYIVLLLDDILYADNSKLFLVRQKSADGCGILTEFFKNDFEIPMGILIGNCGCLGLLLLRQEKSKHACALGIIF